MGSESHTAVARSAWAPFVGLLVGASLAVATAEIVLRRVAPLRPPIREVADGVADLRASNPDILVLGSSHARSFEAVANLLARRSAGGRRMVIVPEEGGTFYAFNWVLQHRLRPLIEERDASGRLVRDRLSQLLLITTYWDSCPVPQTLAANLPSRAWVLDDYLADVAAHGMTDTNRNYVQSRWKALWPFSYLVRDRGAEHLKHGLLQWAHLEPRETPDERRQDRLKTRRGEFESDYATCDDPSQKEDLREILDYLHGRHISVTVVLFPLVQEALTDVAKRTTLQRYAESLEEIARERPFHMVDMTLTAPLAVGDFEPDLDHVTHQGNAKFAKWALDNDLRFLLTPPAAAADTSAQRMGAGS
jgi:hypothetical protein